MTEMQHHEVETALRSYLLGLASPEEQKRVEERLLTDADYFNELERVEECLTDEYVRGELRGIQKEWFDSHFLKSAEHREGLELARLLDRYFSEQDAQNISLPSGPRWRTVMEVVLACTAIVLIVASVLLFQQVSNLRREATHLQQERTAANERERNIATQLAQQQQVVKEQEQLVNKLQQQLADIRKPSISRDFEIASFHLFAGKSRGYDATVEIYNSVEIPTHAQVLRLGLGVQMKGGNYASYRAQLETVEGDVVWTINGLTVKPYWRHNRYHLKEVTVMLPAALMIRSEYLIELIGITQSGAPEILGTYDVEVTRK